MQPVYNSSSHTFAICAYGESPYLRECIESVLHQELLTKVVIATSTPSEYLEKISREYGIKLYVNEKDIGHSNIANDWNFAYSCADTKLVTITHQDDIYFPRYAKVVIDGFNITGHPLIAFTDYAERRNGIDVTDNKLLNIKKIMLLPMRAHFFWNSKLVRRRILSLGSAICCPSVTFVKSNLPDQLFVPGYRSDIDWQAWEKISRMNGEFVYCHEALMSHRIHADSATTAIIADNDRTKEDYEMYCRFWPKWMARLLEHFYRDGEKQNNLSD